MADAERAAPGAEPIRSTSPITTPNGACPNATAARCGKSSCSTASRRASSWITILRKRDAFRAAFAGFDPDIVARWGEPEVATLLADPGIVRHRGKIEATIDGARAYLRIEEREGFRAFLWRYVDGRAAAEPHRQPWREIPAETDLSRRMSKDLKAEGFRFCGPTIVYAFMQACGLVNDHLVTCPAHARLAGPAA